MFNRVYGGARPGAKGMIADYAGARPLYERALAICEKVPGEEHPHTQIYRRNLEGLLAKMQQPPE